jgi:hypothetical protein
MIDFGINKKGRLRSKKTLLKLTLEYYEGGNYRSWFRIPNDLLINDKINKQEKAKLEALLDQIFNGINYLRYSTREKQLLQLYREIKSRNWMID